MPFHKIDEVLATKPLTFNLQTAGGKWKCQVHPSRASYEKARTVAPTSVVPGITRSDSGLSISSTSSAGSTTSSH